MSEINADLTEKTVIIDLKVDRNLLNPTFDCYRVSIDPLATHCQHLDHCVNELRPTDEEYSYLHLAMASHFNHLFPDPFFPQTVFFATNFGQIICVSIDLMSERLTKPKTVYTLPVLDSTLISMSFPTKQLTLISNSNHKNPEILIMSTTSRSASEPWILLSTIRLEEYEIDNRFELFCSQSMDLYHNCRQIDFILGFVDKKPQNFNDLNQNSTQSSFVCQLSWFTIVENSWNVKRLRRMIGNDWPKYISFDFNGSPLLCMVSDKDFTFIHDSDKPIVDTNSKPMTKSDRKLLCTYCQTLEEICVTFKLPVHICKTDISVDLKPSNICVKIKDITEFEGQLCHKIESNSSVWTLMSEKDFQLLEITVNKSDNGLVWNQLIEGNDNCLEITNKDVLEDIHQKLSHLTTEMPDIDSDVFQRDVYNSSGLEECDFTDKSLVFNRYNGNTHSICHRIDLSGSHWMFSMPVQKSFNADTNQLPYFVVRHDVDALVWAPQSSFDIRQFDVKHVATFEAFGYVLASKTNTRFISAPNDFKFVAITDGVRHVYVYRQPIDIKSGEIRNRKTGQEVQQVSNQHVINLNDCHSINGIHSTNDNIFVLSKDKIFLIQIK